MNMQQSPLSLLRATIRQYTHADEAQCVKSLLDASSLSERQREQIVDKGRALVKLCRQDAGQAGTLDVFMQEFSLSSKEGVALMCLAESLLRVPDATTADNLIAEKVLSGDWQDHLGHSDSLFVNASTLGLLLTGKVVTLDQSITGDTGGWLKQLVNRCGEPMIRAAVRQAMKIMGQQYVLGRDIDEAINRGRKENGPATTFSFDMLGEGARTKADAKRYFTAYLNAIQSIGARETQRTVERANGISVKLSALHPRYHFSQKDRVIKEMLPNLYLLALEAKKFGLGFSIDAEEADRLDLSLDIFEALARHPMLAGWQGLGFVLQAYGKRAPWVIDWLVALARETGRRFMVRLVKGAYWDTEIKFAQEQGYTEYPVYTRKANTDLSYQVCAEKLLQAGDSLYPQFATHNAQTVALILALAKSNKTPSFEFQRLHGMGDLLYKQLMQQASTSEVPVRVYAPVGAHKDLLPYLVRRLLENGANSSFVNRFMNQQVPVEEIINDVQTDVEHSRGYRHSAIPLPQNIYRAVGEPRDDTHGLDLANQDAARNLLEQVAAVAQQPWQAGPIIAGKSETKNGRPIHSPADNRITVGYCQQATTEDAEQAIQFAHDSQPEWDARGGNARAEILERAADLLVAKMPEFIGLISYEAGRTLEDGVSEVREAVDFLRYYALQARRHCNSEQTETDTLFNGALKGRGVFFCISPWNFPLAIFIGQVAAALAAGNSVIAKPANPTPLVAYQAIQLLLQAGIPAEVLHFLPGGGRSLGAVINTDPRIKGVVFTGSTGVAQTIHQTLLQRPGINSEAEAPVFIAETGGQNVMIADSSALPEQLVDDIIRSAFLSAGQRCSALRVLYLQDDIADTVITMLQGAMDELSIGQPWKLPTDMGPVIDQQAREGLQQHIQRMHKEAHFLHSCPLPPEAEEGSFLAPHCFELQSIKQLPEEIFGPILHIIRFKQAELKQVIRDINDTGFGLTLGVHSRIEAFADYVVKHTHVGNNYINRNMVGAVVGVNPFGGQGLSGTGPKAGGPNYLPRFTRQDQQPVPETIDSGKAVTKVTEATEMTEPGKFNITEAYHSACQHQPGWNLVGATYRSELLVDAAIAFETRCCGNVCDIASTITGQVRQHYTEAIQLPGPTGETNQLMIQGRGLVFCGQGEGKPFADFARHILAALAMGNSVIAQPSPKHYQASLQLAETLVAAGIPANILQIAPPIESIQSFVITDSRTAVVAWSGSWSQALALQQTMTERGGAITPLVTDTSGPDYLLRFAVEKTVTTNIVATGGNALLLNLDDQ